jgi:hypothetical protein
VTPFFISHGSQFGYPLQRATAPLVNDARRGSNVGVTESQDVLLNEIDESALPLQQGEQLQRGTQIAEGGCWLRGLGVRRPHSVASRFE